MYVQVVVETPQNLTKRQRELLAEFDKLSSKETQPEAAGILRQSQGVLRKSAPPRPDAVHLTLDSRAFTRDNMMTIP